MSTVLDIKNLYKKYTRKDAFVIRDVNLQVSKGELLGLLGESGSGKTTLLRLIAGFEEPDRGAILVNGQVVVDANVFVAPEKRKVGMVFQDYALFPHMDIQKNVCYGLHGYSKEEIKDRVKEVLKLVGLQSFAGRYPHQLSGGQQQRAALARALAPRPSILLLDEPFSNLDVVLKEQVREDLRNILKRTETTAIFVTHDTKDALSTADRIALLKDGHIQQSGSPKELYNKPSNIYTASFLGKVNIIQALTKPGGYESQIGFIPCNRANGTDQKVTLAIRPEKLAPCSEGHSDLYGAAQLITYQGDHQLITLQVISGKSQYKLVIKANSEVKVSKGEVVHFRIEEDYIKVLDTCWYPAAAEQSPLEKVVETTEKPRT